jgi:hypothetical protein
MAYNLFLLFNQIGDWVACWKYPKDCYKCHETIFP